MRALLAYLAVEAQEAHSREKLVGLLWPEMPEKRARASLSQALYNLRRLIDSQNASSPIITATQQSIQFSLADDVWVDVHHFQAYFEASNNHVHCNSETCPWCAEQLEAASQLYRGDFLEELSFDSSLAFDEWVLFMQQRFQRQVLDGLYRLADYFIKQNEILMALPYAWRQVELDPLDERATRQLMHLLAANNQRSQALVQFERLQVIVANELKVAPELETVALRDQIRDLHNSPTKVKTKGDNLPAFLTPLVGRQQELTEIVVQCENPDCRLLTILGPGGSGKTRLALEVARSSLETFRHGVFFVSLNPVQSPVSILPAIADALDLPRGEQDEYQEQLENFLRDKNLLLVLDGFEHLLEGASLIAEILHKAPGFKVLVTSRTRSNIKGEHLYFLSGMRYPEEGASESEIRDADAVKLLVAGLRRTWPDYEPTPEDLNTLLQICRQVLGMPLGILLAASWGATLRVEEIADMTSQSLDFLAADWTDTPARQRSLRATFDYTWNLLGERERTIFQSLSVFRGAFTRQAARSISDASPYELRALVDRSLILSKTPGWYEVHELLRQYGREKLAQSAQIEQDVCGRHSEYYLGQFAHLGDALKSAQQVAAVSSIDLEHGNYRAAWNWAASQGAAPQLARMLDTLCLYYDLSLRYPDGESACCAAIEGLSLGLDAVDLHLLLARIFTWQSRFSRLLGQSDIASQLMEKSQACLEKVKSAGYKVRNVEAFFLLEQGNTHFYKNRRTAAACYSKALELYRSSE